MASMFLDSERKSLNWARQPAPDPPNRARLLFSRAGRAAMSPDSAIERILELSADAQIKRRQAAEDTPAFHNLTGAIVAYGKALGLLSKLKEIPTELYSNN
jgi:hypothetical protein